MKEANYTKIDCDSSHCLTIYHSESDGYITKVLLKHRPNTQEWDGIVRIPSLSLYLCKEDAPPEIMEFLPDIDLKMWEYHCSFPSRERCILLARSEKEAIAKAKQKYSTEFIEDEYEGNAYLIGDFQPLQLEDYENQEEDYEDNY